MVMMMRAPLLMASRRSPEFLSSPMASTAPSVWSKPEMVSCSCASSTVRSVTTMTLANTGLFSVLNREASRYAVHAMELDLPDPALCWMR